MPYYSKFKGVAYDPKYFGLTPVAEFELREPDYSFDTFKVWYHSENEKYYWAQDSGCSCPSPFEGYGCRETGDEISDSLEISMVLDKLDSGDFFEAVNAMASAAVSSYDRDYAVKEATEALADLVKFDSKDNNDG